MGNDLTMERLVALAGNRGFVYQGSEIYGGLANSWDYGPLGVEMKNNIKQAWWQKFVRESPYNTGVDCAILMNPRVWQASGHVAGFSDPLIDCKSCRARFRADQLIENWQQQNADAGTEHLSVDGADNETLVRYISEHEIPCPTCGKHDFTGVRKFNLMFRTYQGVTEDSGQEIYLRPETAQGIFVNFGNVQRSSRRKIPFGVAQIGKAFRNEITPGNFIFRTREFEQMELEFFCEPDGSMEWFNYWRDFCRQWLFDLGIPAAKLREREHAPQELAFYSIATTDFEFEFPFGWGELWGVANRTDYDLGRHIEYSKVDLTYFDPAMEEKYIPYVIEPSVGVDRLFLAFLSAAYAEETLEDGSERTVLRLHPALAPIKIGILPLSRKLTPQCEDLFALLSPHYTVELDDTQSIGRRYRRHDEIGTPFCVTYDFDSETDRAVTIRDRDTMEQVRVPIDNLIDWFNNKFRF